MTIRELLAELKTLGITIQSDGKQITANPANKVTPAVMASLKQHKPLFWEVWNNPKVKRVVKAVNGRIVDIGDFETAMEMNARMVKK